jgi:hypothetical protein
MNGASGDMREHMAQVGFRINVVELGGADQRIHGDSTLTVAVGIHKQEIFSAQSDPAVLCRFQWNLTRLNRSMSFRH